MEKKFTSEKALTLIKETYKPSLTNRILMTVIGFAMFGGVWMDIADGNYSRIGILSSLTSLVMLVVGGMWTSYYYRMIDYKREIEDYKKDPDSYEW